ncbi:MAG TPA: hypothetical protein PKK18_11655 [Chitinophagales bacterium]|nr:hypothetical protein [Chitinophagales bacterium]HMX61053.1 hypothetical protein [Chitinophagales bacterium]HNA39451.1 hypothetical protein [Chitinophagales bacterium]HNF19946.1 hypothetical protein [Chitinophagales bacterium]HNF52268.1 hypothetical protein [Chitinophagales bacterium]
MKSIHTIILSILIANFVAAQEKVNLKFNFYFANSNEGSIRKTKLVVKSDGVKIGESTVKDQDKYNSVEVNIPKGYHRITAVACAQNDGIWEERTLANNYSLDCIYEKSQNWNAGYIIDLRFDLKDMDVKADEEILFGDDMLDNLTNNNTASSTNTNSTTDYQTALKKLNDYLKTFDNGYYGYWEVKDGYIYDRFKAGKYNKFKMEDMEGAVIQPEYSRVIFKCKGDNKCIETDWKPNGREDYTQFTTNGSYNYKELADLLNNFRDAYLGKKSTNSTSNPTQKYTESSEFLDGLKSNIDIADSGNNRPPNGRERVKQTTDNNNSSNKTSYTEALLELNKFLKVYDKELNKSIEVSNGYIIEHFRGSYTSKAKIKDIAGVEKDDQYNVVHLYCKNNAKCVYSSYMKSDYDYFNYNCSSKEDMNTLYKLMRNFWDALNGKQTNNSPEVDFDKYKSNINILENTEATSVSTKPTAKINYTIVANQPSVFKKGDRVVIEIGSFDDHFQLNKKSEYDGETGTVINLEYDDLNYSYYGKIKMDSDNKIVEFTDITPQLIKIK